MSKIFAALIALSVVTAVAAPAYALNFSQIPTTASEK